MPDDFTPYWLIHEPGKQHGFATVGAENVVTENEAIAAWRVEYRDDIRAFGMDDMPVAARLITEPLHPR